MKLLREKFKTTQIRRHFISFINFSLKSNNLNISKEKNLDSSLFLCVILKKGIRFFRTHPLTPSLKGGGE
jgi:hypothetical protein